MSDARTAIKERPIPFSGPMVRAILEERKTMTRRVIIPQPIYTPPLGDYYVGQWWWPCADEDRYKMRWGENGDCPAMRAKWAEFCPYGESGDRLWVRETWAVDRGYDRFRPRDLAPGEYVWYRADELSLRKPTIPASGKWRLSIFMPRWASRILLEITEKCLERVQDISEADAIAEDFRIGTPGFTFPYLWDSLNAKRGYGWDTNPWVWVIAFTVKGDER